MKKLTLSLDEETIAIAHKLARANNDSISNMVGNFFRDMQKPRTEYVPDHPTVRKLYGILKGSDIPMDKKAIRELILQKDRKSTRLNSSHLKLSRMPSSA